MNNDEGQSSPRAEIGINGMVDFVSVTEFVERSTVVVIKEMPTTSGKTEQHMFFTAKIKIRHCVTDCDANVHHLTLRTRTYANSRCTDLLSYTYFE